MIVLGYKNTFCYFFPNIILSCNASFTQVDNQMEQSDHEGNERRRDEGHAEGHPEDRGEDEEGCNGKEQRDDGVHEESGQRGDDAASVSRSGGVDDERGTQVRSSVIDLFQYSFQ